MAYFVELTVLLLALVAGVGGIRSQRLAHRSIRWEPIVGAFVLAAAMTQLIGFALDRFNGGPGLYVPMPSPPTRSAQLPVGGPRINPSSNNNDPIKAGPKAFRIVGGLLTPTELPRERWGSFGAILLTEHDSRAQTVCSQFHLLLSYRTDADEVRIDGESLGIRRAYWLIVKALRPVDIERCDALTRMYDYERSARMRSRLHLEGRGPFFVTIRHDAGTPVPLAVWDMSSVPDDELGTMFAQFLNFYRVDGRGQIKVKANARQKFKSMLYAASPAISDLWGVSKATAKATDGTQ